MKGLTNILEIIQEKDTKNILAAKCKIENKLRKMRNTSFLISNESYPRYGQTSSTEEIGYSFEEVWYVDGVCLKIQGDLDKQYREYHAPLNGHQSSARDVNTSKPGKLILTCLAKSKQDMKESGVYSLLNSKKI